MKKKKKIDLNLLIAVGVLISSFGALYIYSKQARIMGEQTRILLEQTKANAWPHLTIELDRSASTEGNQMEKLQIRISNKGTGPAVVENALLQFQEESVESWSELYAHLEVPDSVPIFHSNDILNGQVIEAGESFNLINWTENNSLMNYIFSKGEEISLTICYKSVYGDSWVVKREGFKTNLEQNQRRRVEECSTEQKTFKE